MIFVFLLLVFASEISAICPSLQNLTGEIVIPSNPEYTVDRLNWNQAAQNEYPCVIVFCLSVSDVSNAVKWAVANSVQISVRSGRHSYEGFSIGDGIVVDMSRLKR